MAAIYSFEYMKIPQICVLNKYQYKKIWKIKFKN